MKFTSLNHLDSFIAGLITSNKGCRVYSVKQLGGHQSGLVEITLVKSYGETNSPVFVEIIFNPVTLEVKN